MKQLSFALIPKAKKETTKRKQLLSIIRKKRALLENLVIKTEMFRVNLEMAKQEYMVKVGNLFLKDNQLDLEIIRLRNIIMLLDEGQTYEQAINKIAQTYYAQQIEIDKEREKVKHEEEIVQKRVSRTEIPLTEIKKIWKKLIARFHPDLVQDIDEKKKRDGIMKAINRAYQEGDYEVLVKIEQDHLADKETSIENLEDILLRLLNEINVQEILYVELRESEWYDWMIKIEKAKNKKLNIFADTERNLLNDIVVKFEIVKKLKEEILQKDTSISVL